MHKEETEYRYRFSKPCKLGHVGPDGQNVRYMTGGCISCSRHREPGPYEPQYELPDIRPMRVTLTPEESRLRHIQQVMEYNRRNPEKHRARVAKYQAKPEVKKKHAEDSAKRYQERKDTPEHKARQKELYELNKERKREEQRRYYQKHKDVLLAKRAKYYAENREHIQETILARKLRKEAESDSKL